MCVAVLLPSALADTQLGADGALGAADLLFPVGRRSRQARGDQLLPERESTISFRLLTLQVIE